MTETQTPKPKRASNRQTAAGRLFLLELSGGRVLSLNPADLKQTVIDGVAREAGGRSVDQLAQDENRVIVGLLKLRGLDSKVSVGHRVGQA